MYNSPILVPSLGDVPRPNSSTKTSDFDPHSLIIEAISPISAPNALLPSTGISADAPLTKIASKRRSFVEADKGAQRPTELNKKAEAIDLISVLLPLQRCLEQQK